MSSDTPRVSRRACGIVNVQDIRSCEQQPSALERADAYGDGHTRVEGVDLRPHPAELSHCENIWCPSVRSVRVLLFSFLFFLIRLSSVFFLSRHRHLPRSENNTHALSFSPSLLLSVRASLSLSLSLSLSVPFLFLFVRGLLLLLCPPPRCKLCLEQGAHTHRG